MEQTHGDSSGFSQQIAGRGSLLGSLGYQKVHFCWSNGEDAPARCSTAGGVGAAVSPTAVQTLGFITQSAFCLYSHF